MKKIPFCLFLQKLYKKACLKSQNYAHTNTDTRAHIHTSGSKNLIRYIVGKAWEKAGEEINYLKMLECDSNAMEVVVGTYKKGVGRQRG